MAGSPGLTILTVGIEKHYGYIRRQLQMIDALNPGADFRFLAVDNAVAAGDPAALERFEQAIARCAGAALLLLSRGGEVGFHARGVKVAARGGRNQRVRILDALARLAPVPPEAAPDFPPMRRGDLRRLVS